MTAADRAISAYFHASCAPVTEKLDAWQVAADAWLEVGDYAEASFCLQRAALYFGDRVESP